MTITVTNLTLSHLEVGGVLLRAGETKSTVPDSGIDEAKSLSDRGLVSYSWTPDIRESVAASLG